MRISDWSSDVCSSDLRVRGIGRRHQHVVVAFEAKIDLVVDAGGIRMERRRDEHGREQQGRAGPVGFHGGACVLRSRSIDVVEHDAGELVGIEVRGGVVDAVDRGLARSEEHKSELQSLMSISYAVFYFDKKNNTLTNDAP